MAGLAIAQLNHVALHVADLAASIAFYRDVMGLALIDRPAFDFPGAWFELGSAGNGVPRQELHLIAREPKDGQPYSIPRERHYALLIPDAAAAADHLRKHGLTFTGPNHRPDGAIQLYVRDPDQHLIELCTEPLAA